MGRRATISSAAPSAAAAASRTSGDRASINAGQTRSKKSRTRAWKSVGSRMRAETGMARLPPDEEVDPIWRIFDVPVGVAPWLFPQAVAYQVKHAGYTGAGFLIFIMYLILIGSIVSTVVYPMY